MLNFCFDFGKELKIAEQSILDLITTEVTFYFKEIESIETLCV